MVQCDQWIRQGNSRDFPGNNYDPVYYPTATGDGQIKLQYKLFSNIDLGSEIHILMVTSHHRDQKSVWYRRFGIYFQ
jgi:hypothetical protein